MPLKESELQETVEARREEAWRRAAELLSEEGRLAWLLGRSLVEVLSGSGTRDGREEDLVASLRELVRKAAAGSPVGQRVASPAPGAGSVGPSRSPAPAPKKPHSAPPAGPLGQPFAWPQRLEDRYVVVFIGSEPVHRQWVTLAMGIQLDGTKCIFGLWEGSTANESVSQTLVEDLAGRGLSAEQGLLFVLDGNTALDQAVRRQWPLALVAHCQGRLRQEVLEHLPAAARAAVGGDLDRIWALPPTAAVAALRELADRLRTPYPGAAARLERSGEASLVVARLDLPGVLAAHLRVAGPVRVALEDAGRLGRTAGRGLVAVATGLRQLRTRRLIGYEALPLLARRLQESAAQYAKPSR